MRIQKLTGIGKRERNQDLIYIDRLESGAYFFLIADGMGGYENGDEAAKIVSENIFTFLNFVKSINEHTIQQAVQKANLAIKQFNIRNNIKSGATVGGIIVEKNKSYIFWVGDVMVCQMNKDKVLFQTTSHTLKNDLLESESIRDKRSIDRYKHIVTRSISGKPSESNIGYHCLEYSEKDSFIICSDGVHNLISSSQILRYIYSIDGVEKLEQDFLIDSNDNYSLIVVSIN